MIHPDFKMKAAFAAFIFLRKEMKKRLPADAAAAVRWEALIGLS